MTTHNCPLCFEVLSTKPSSTTPCAHTFCTDCLDKWTQTGKDTCPLCRTVCLTGSASSKGSEANPTQRPVLAMSVSVPTAVSTPGGPSLRDRMEAEHAQRASARERRRELERRLDRYRSDIFTPSGRPFESLPVVSLDQMQRELRGNRQSLLSSMATGRDSLAF